METGQSLSERIREWARALGFSGARVTALYSGGYRAAGARLTRWIEAGYAGEMHYMTRSHSLRLDPCQLLPDVRSVISVTLDYWPEADLRPAMSALADPGRAYISRYALGRDYHRIIRRKLQSLAERIARESAAPCHYRVFSDSAPVLEVAYAAESGLGWRGKNTLLLSRKGSFSFLGEIYSTLDLPSDFPQTAHCGSCEKCVHACPTGAIIAPYTVDARLCISYLTIEYAGSIPEKLRPLMGNRIYGCDDCQLICPWNRRAAEGNSAFMARQGLEKAELADLMAWEEADFLSRLEGSPIRRIGYERWLRNLAVALGNALSAGADHPAIRAALLARAAHPSVLVREHVAWALAQTEKKTRP
ncbi:MAG: tRNA epoxyqueuosine(34) reductase QueG [Zoogloeaceae bacterium]|jgi:epoxyqueuosine reductase|nr:tRNA epoxyqueuosine(34) reductase QueG [Zoogloeaceae bacterium]